MKHQYLNLRVVYLLLIAVMIVLPYSFVRGQYVQAERDDTVRIYAKTPFDTARARVALARGTGTIKGVAFTRPKNGYGMKVGKAIYAAKTKILLMPVTPYLLEYLDLKKKENHKKLKYVYISPDAWRFRLEAITNSDGEFTFPEMKPGKYYLESVVNWSTTGSYDRYTGSGSNGYATTNYYTREYYSKGHADLVSKFVEITKENEILEIKLK